MTSPLVELLLATADDEFVLGYRDSEWTAVAPLIEEDIAFSSIAQDEIGHARALYELAETQTGRGADHLALGRRMHEYRHCRLVEHPRDDWAFTIARQYLYDHADAVRVAALRESTFRPLADLMHKVAREEKYHLLHTRSWIARLAHGSDESRARLERGLTTAWPLALGVFEPLEHEGELVADGALPQANADLVTTFRDSVVPALAAHGLEPDRDATPAYGGRRGLHSSSFSTLWSEMTLVYRQDPDAAW